VATISSRRVMMAAMAALSWRMVACAVNLCPGRSNVDRRKHSVARPAAGMFLLTPAIGVWTSAEPPSALISAASVQSEQRIRNLLH
jgi:hypothetical protein